MAVHRINQADMQMAVEMFNASPDGQAERDRVQALLESLPKAEVTISGYWVCADGRCGKCRDCYEAGTFLGLL